MELINHGHHFRNDTEINNDDSVDVEIQIIAAVVVSLAIVGCLGCICYNTCHYNHDYTQL